MTHKNVESSMPLPLVWNDEEKGEPLYVLHFSSFFTPTGQAELKFNFVRVFSTMDRAKGFIRASLAARGLTEADLDSPLDDEPDLVITSVRKHRLSFNVNEVRIDGLGMSTFD